MPGTIIDNVVIQYPNQLTEEQVKAILQQSQEEFKVINRSLGGLDLEIDHDGSSIIVRAWERSAVKRVRRIDDYLPKEKEEEISQVATNIPQMQVLVEGAEGNTEGVNDGMVKRLRNKFKNG